MIVGGSIPTPQPSVIEALGECRYQRFMSTDDMPPHVTGHCRWCGTKCEGRRRAWCSAECNDEFLIRYSSSEAARAVRHRDHCICTHCGIDVNALRIIRGEHRATARKYRLFYGYSHRRLEDQKQMAVEWGPWQKYWWANRRLWAAHHVIPVKDGGGCCGLGNLITLCVACHNKAHGKGTQ